MVCSPFDLDSIFELGAGSDDSDEFWAVDAAPSVLGGGTQANNGMAYRPSFTGSVHTRFNYPNSTKPGEHQTVRETGGRSVTVHLKQRTYSPVLRNADLPTIQIPWWNNRTLRYHIT